MLKNIFSQGLVTEILFVNGMNYHCRMQMQLPVCTNEDPMIFGV